MALEEFDEHEQSERVRTWLRQHSGSIILGVSVGIAGLAGWHYWKHVKAETTQKAQVQYQVLLDAEKAGDAEAVTKAAQVLRSEFGSTPYGLFAALNQAQDAVKSGDLEAADQALAWARSARSDLPALNELIAIRSVQVMLAKGEGQKALDLAKSVTSEGYKGLVAELRGDALVMLERKDDARIAYDDALAALDATSPQRSFVEMKRNDLLLPAPAAVPGVPEPSPAVETAADQNKANS